MDKEQIIKEKFIELGRQGAETRWSNYRLALINDIRGLTDKKELDFYLSLNPSNQSLREILMELRKRNV